MTLGLMPNIENKEKKMVGEGGREEKGKKGMGREGRKEGKRGEDRGGEGREGEGRIEEGRRGEERGKRKKRQRTWAKAGTSFSLGHSHKSHLRHSLFL